jgi:hypothetical protein
LLTHDGQNRRLEYVHGCDIWNSAFPPLGGQGSIGCQGHTTTAMHQACQQ